MPSDAGTIGDALDAATSTLRDAGVPEPRHEALRIWADLSRKNPAEVVMQSRQAALPDAVRPFNAAVTRRAAGEPLAYVTGWAGFRRLTLCSDARALIPRPETEGLVDAALERIRTGAVADVGTGTGAIALALKAEGEFSDVFGLDRSADALALARTNGVLTGLSVSWLEGDLLAPLAGRLVDLVISNPPYLTEEEYAGLESSVRDYEPQLALVAGEDGQAILRRLVVGARAAVSADGWLALEVDCRRAAETARLATNAGWQEVTVLDDLFGRARYVLARQGSS